MVKAMAPKAPMGAAFITMFTSLNTGLVRASKKFSTGLPASPTMASDTPNSTATSSTCRMLSPTNGLIRVLGMMSITKPTSVMSCDLATKPCTAFWSRSAGLMFMPAPGWNTLATTRPTTSASVEKVRKYAMALPNTRPTVDSWVMPAMPVTMVRKITGAMIILISLMKASPSGFMASP